MSRLLAAYRELGAGALAHGNRGRRPHNAVPEAVAATVVRLAATRYTGTNHTHLTELLDEQEGIAIGRSTVWRILTRAGMLSPPRHRVRRERMRSTRELGVRSRHTTSASTLRAFQNV